MLSRLRVENFAVVEKVEIDFSPHLNIFTGETGAGKSILIDAISLFLNKRISSNAIRSGADKLIVEALFSAGNDEFVLRRELKKNKSFSFINGDMVPFNQLKEKAEDLLNIYGQNEHIFLLHTANHKIYLDRFAKNFQLLDELSELTHDLKKSIKILEDLNTKSEQLNERLELIDFQISEIENLKMEKDEDKTLERRLKILSSSEEILSKSRMLIQDFYQAEDSVYNRISERLKDLEYLKKIYAELVEFDKEITDIYNILPELSALLTTIGNQVEYSEEELNDIQQRLHNLDRLKSKHKTDLDGILKKYLQLKEEKELLLNVEFSIQEVEKEIKTGLEKYKGINISLRKVRKEKALQLSRLVEGELSQLEMKRATFFVNFTEVEPDLENFSEKGTDKIEFYFSSNPGQHPGKIKEVVSGGELSRLMLVLKSIVEDEGFSTYMFDEIDSGIGGKTAQFVGERLKKISLGNQVICISHLPQIASFADKHFLIQKKVRDNQTYSYTTELSHQETVQEIARLMAGRDVNEDVLAAAENLLTAVKKRS
ncbi:MAG: DNA repair protein RecN [Candidatus Aminicenantes bacterium]|nr:DNA repair protein RecN [Candidatus Aminicenantes bacterium]